MAKLYISEFASLPQLDSGGNVYAQCPVIPAIAEQTIDFSGGATPSAAFNAATKFILINTDTTCALAFGTAPVAATSQRMPADSTRFYGVPNTGTYKVSAVAVS